MIQEKFVLITPAKNEEKYIELTIKSVIAQTQLPEKWIIVSDNSNDNTDDIVKKYSKRYSFITLHRRTEGKGYNFGSKVYAINSGMPLARDIDYKYVGFLDADISFEPDYFEKILIHMESGNKLGITGGLIYEKIGNRFIPQFNYKYSVAGAVQFFRKACWEDIGGYIPSPFTLYKGICKIAPGTMLIAQNGEIKVKRWYNYQPEYFKKRQPLAYIYHWLWKFF